MTRSATTRRAPLAQLLLTVAAFFFAAPLYVIVQTSAKGEGWLKNYKTVLRNPHLPRFVENSLIVALTTTATVIVVTCLAAYALSKLHLRLSTLILNVILIGLMIPTAVIMLPLLIEARNFGLVNNYFALVGPYAALLVPFTVLMAKNYVDGLPDEILEAARIDGCNSMQMLRHIVLPLIRPILVVVGLWSFLNCWNEYFLANLFLSDPDKQMITQAPNYYIGEYSHDVGKVFASLIIISAPVLALFIGVQRTFVEGISAGSSK